MITARYFQHRLQFKRPSGTSRGVLHEKETWFIQLNQGDRWGIGECGILRGLSVDDRPDYEEKLKWLCDNIHRGEDVLWNELSEFPSLQMGLESAFLSLQGEKPFQLFNNEFALGNDHIPINGLIWMGDTAFMVDQVEEKIQQGFRCIKMKIGAIDFDQELAILKSIRKRFSAHDMMIRVDANGAFGTDAIYKLEALHQLQIHSIEQPLPRGNWEAQRRLCQQTPLPIALDEELIGVFSPEDKVALLEEIQPQYIILKPSFIGGFRGADQWYQLAKQCGIDAWVTSALESNIGLNAIAQWTYQKGFKGPQGLGTGSLFTNNIAIPLQIKNGYLSSNKHRLWPKLPLVIS